MTIHAPVIAQADATAPIRRAVTVTPHDSNDMAIFSRAIWVGTGGDLVAVFEDGVAVPFLNVPDGTLLPIVVKRVNATNTTASSIVALF